MLEILYDKDTKRVAGWCSVRRRMGRMRAKLGQRIVVLPIDVPEFPSINYYLDLDGRVITFDPTYVPPPDYKAQWAKATLLREKVGILARIVGLEK